MKKIPFDQNNLTDLTPEQIEAFKLEYKEVFKITVEDKSCFIHKPDRQTLDLASLSSAKKDSLFNETILKNCWLAGDKEMIFDDEYFYPAGKQLQDVVKYKNGELKKL